MKTKSLITLLILLFSQASVAQTTEVSISKPELPTFVLPPVMDLIDSAIQHSAMVRMRRLEIEAKECNKVSHSNYWTRNLGFQADARYGTFNNFSTNADALSTSIFSTNSKQVNYGAGVFIKFPLQDLIDRKNQVRQSKIEIEQAKSFAEAQADEVRQLVIRQYQDLLLKQRLLAIRSAALGNARVNREMVEKEFRNGTINVSEYVRISDIVDRTQTDYETARAEFATSKMILEDIVGFSLTATQIRTR